MERLASKDSLSFGKSVINSVCRTPEQVSLAVGYGVYSIVSVEFGVLIMSASGSYLVATKLIEWGRSRGLDRNKSSS